MSSFGGTVKLQGESEYQRALRQITQSLKEQTSEMKILANQYDKNDKSTQAMASKSEALNQKLQIQSERLNILKARYNEMNNTYGKNSDAQKELTDELTKARSKLDEIGNTLGKTSKEYLDQQKVVEQLENKQESYNKAVSDAKIEMNKAQAEVNKTTRELDKLENELDDNNKQLKENQSNWSSWKQTLADLRTKAITTAINGLKSLGKALISVGKQAISSYADYEQLVGGVETLFKDSAKEVQNYANIAYKTAQLSANEYMQTVTSFSASLLQGLNGDTAKAAKIADMAIIDMSDNANKMGTSMEMIQNAYQGFAKDNFTMLDNLKLGYGGTAGEMARLINETGVLGNSMKVTAKTVKDVPFDKMLEAIHKVQEQMGITGTSAKEASKTISGSVNAMKSSWQNLLVAIADDNQDLGKSVKEFVDSTITASKNLVPRIKVVVDGVKKLINSIVKDVFPKLKKEIPELKPLISVFEWFIKNKSLVVGSIQAMVTAFAVSKIYNFTKSISDSTKSIIELTRNTLLSTTATNASTTAQIAGASATGLLTKATTLLNAAWKANPVGLVVAGITALISVISIVKGKTDELTDAEKAQKEALENQTQTINDNKKAWDDLKESKQNAIDTGMTELSHYSSLYDELQGIVDQNGKVKKGYEERASFITSTLSNALGIEIKNVNGVIKGYDSLKSKIDEVMEKKKAQIILDSQESLYAEAINNQTNALKTLNDLETQIQKNKKEHAKLTKELEQLEANHQGTMSNYQMIQYNREKAQLEEKINNLNTETNTMQSNYNKQKDLLSEYAYNIGIYESNMAYAHAGKYNEMSTVNWDYVKDFQKAGDAEKAQLEDQIKITETNLNLLKELKKKSGEDIYDSQIKASEKQLEEQKKALKQYENTAKIGLDATKVQWSNGLDKILSEITGANIEFKEDGKGNVQMYIDGVASGEKKSKEEMADLVSNTIKEVTKKDKDAKKAGEDLIDGVNNGIKNQNKQSSVFSSIASFGNKILSKLKNSLQEKSPSKATNEMGRFLLEGLGLGIDKEENNVLKQVSNVGKNVLSALQGELSNNLNLGNIQTGLNGLNLNETSSSNINTQNNFNSLVEAFKLALSDMKVEMDREEMGRFVDKTVADAIYN